MAGSNDNLSIWEKMNIFGWLVAILAGIVFGSVLLDVYQDYSYGDELGTSFTFAIVLMVILLACIFCIWLSGRHMKKYPHTTWLTFSDMLCFFLPYLEAKEDRDSYCSDEFLRRSNLWKRFGTRWKKGTFCWAVLWSSLVVFLCVDTYAYYHNPYEPGNKWIGRARVFYDTENVLSACYIRLVVVSIFLFVAIVVFCRVKDYLSEWSFSIWFQELNVSCEELDREFDKATYCGKCVWCGERFLFLRGELDGLIISYEQIKNMEIKRTNKLLLDYLPLPQWTLLLTNEKGEEYAISAVRVKPFQKVMNIWEKKQLGNT